MTGLRALALALTVLTGFSGLVYEVTWEKWLATLLGSHSAATAAVLGIFLGGLALGYALFARITLAIEARAARRGREPRLLAAYGAVEAAIGLYALAFPGLFGAVQRLSVALPGSGGGLAFAADVALCALLIGPPTLLMGGTIPMLTQALSRRLDEATRIHAFVYGFNTLGGFCGALAAGFWLVPRLGLVGVLEAMAAINLAAGLTFLAVGGRAPEPVPAPLAAGRAGLAQTRVAGFAAYAAVALLNGFAMMTVQTVLNRLGALSFGASQFTFSMVVAVFVLCIALGSFAVSALRRIPPGLIVGNQIGLALFLFALYGPLQDAPYWAHVLRSRFGSADANFYPYHGAAFLGVLAVIGIPVALSGASLPLLFHHLRHEVGDLGAVAGRLYSWNTLGSFLGALLGGYALLYWLDLHAVLRLAVAALTLAAGLLAWRVLRVRPSLPAAALALAWAGLALLPAWQPRRLAAGLFRQRATLPITGAGPDAFFQRFEGNVTIRFHTDDPTASITVKEYPRPAPLKPDRSILSNGKSDSALERDYRTTALIGILPALLAERAERAFVVGFGVGVTAGELAALDEVREVHVAEIAPGVIRAAPYFAHGNLDAARNPKVIVHAGDAYRTLLRSREHFDVIVSEPSNPWVAGVEMLYSREFLSAARDRLTPRGVFAQWFHTYETDDEAVAIVLRTFRSVFEHVSLWHTMGPDLLLLGFRDPSHARDLERLAGRARRSDFAAALGRVGIRSLPALLAHERMPLDVVREIDLPGAVHTLWRPILGHRAARAFFAGRGGELPRSAGLAAARVGAEASLLRRWAEAHGGDLGPAARDAVIAEVCKDVPTACATWLARWLAAEPDSARLAETLARLRRRADLKGPVGEVHLAHLARLFASGGGADESPLSPRAAAILSEAFVRYYEHAAPFSRRILGDLWRRCRAPRGRDGACAEGLARVERQLGDLGVEIPADPRRRRAESSGTPVD